MFARQSPAELYRAGRSSTAEPLLCLWGHGGKFRAREIRVRAICSREEQRLQDIAAIELIRLHSHSFRKGPAPGNLQLPLPRREISHSETAKRNYERQFPERCRIGKIAEEVEGSPALLSGIPRDNGNSDG